MNPDHDQPGTPRAGGLVVLVFGFVFVQADAGGLNGGLQTAVRIVGVIAAVILFAALNRARAVATEGPGLDRRFWIIVAAEVIALVAGLVVINAVFGAHELTVPWIAIVVGAHFLGFISLWKARVYLVLAVALIVLGLAGFALDAFGASELAIRVVSGLGSGVVLYAAAGNALLRLRRSGSGPRPVER